MSGKLFICEAYIGSHLSSSTTVSTHDADQDADNLGDEDADNSGDERAGNAEDDYADSDHDHESHGGDEGGAYNLDDGLGMYHNRGESLPAS